MWRRQDDAQKSRLAGEKRPGGRCLWTDQWALHTQRRRMLRNASTYLVQQRHSAFALALLRSGGRRLALALLPCGSREARLPRRVLGGVAVAREARERPLAPVALLVLEVAGVLQLRLAKYRKWRATSRGSAVACMLEVVHTGE